LDINLARTFLEIASSHSFVQAAERLHITQTAVSARIKTLEALLGRQLFWRNKAGASLTPAGEQFMRHALTLVQVWDPLLPQWLLWMRSGAPDLALRTEVSLPEDLLERVANGTLDLAIVYAPRQRPGLRIELLIEEKLVLVSTAPVETPHASSYVYVDWGPEFAAQHSLAFPELSSAAVSANLGPLGLAYVLAGGGAGYFRENVVRAHVKAGRLHRVPGAPEFLYPAYAVYAENADPKTLKPALAGLRQVAESLGSRGPRRRK
jgi:DNA-binding transcriptional LysR family regulator